VPGIQARQSDLEAALRLVVFVDRDYYPGSYVGDGTGERA